MRRACVTFLRSLAAVALSLGAGLALLAWQVDRLGGHDDARPSDAIVVLGARVSADGQPGPDLAARTEHGVRLWQAGLAPHLICTGGFKDEPLSAAAVCRRRAAELGVPQDRILLADGGNNTMGDAAESARVMAGQGWRSAILVSHPLHLYRARWLFRRAGVEVVTSPTSTETGRIAPSVRAWYAAREAVAMVVTALGGWKIVPPEWVARLQRWSNGWQ